MTSRRQTLLVLVAVGVAAAIWLPLDPRALVPGGGGLSLLTRLLGAAFSPALHSQDPTLASSSLLPLIFAAIWHTLRFAAMSLSLAILLAAPLALLASEGFWANRHPALRGLRRVARVFTAALRSVHELLLAVLLLAAFGLSELAAVLAIALPYAGILAKVYAELLDEAPADAADALVAAGVGGGVAFFVGRVARSAPELTAYSFYRFECGLRSAAVLGFFGIPTLGLRIRQSFENAYYDELWSYLYALLLLILVVETWSMALRRSMAR